MNCLELWFFYGNKTCVLVSRSVAKNPLRAESRMGATAAEEDVSEK